MKSRKVATFLKNNAIIIGIMVLSAFLNVFGIWKLGYANLYYSSAVYSMGKSFHAFLFNSIDTLGFMSIDKPPLGFWIQVLFTKIFGFSGVTVLIPEAIAGVISVFLLYRIIIKRFGKLPAVISSLALAVTPIFVAVCRNNTIDSLLIVTLLIATEFAIRAAEKSRPKYLLLSALFIGIGFNIKMLQAYIIVPAVYLTYIILSNQKIVKRILTCLLSIALMAAVSLTWVVFVDLIPASQRPWVGSSTSNSEIDLSLGYNGFKRIVGGVFGGNGGNKGGNMGTPPNGSNQNGEMQAPPNGNSQNGEMPTPPNGNNQNGEMQAPPNGSSQNGETQALPNGNNQNGETQAPTDGSSQNSEMQTLQNGNSDNSASKDNKNSISSDKNFKSDSKDFGERPNDMQMTGKPQGGMGGGSEAGETSPIRLFTTNNAGQIAWFVAPCLIFSVLGIAFAVKKRKELKRQNPAIIYFISAFIPMFIYYSFASGLAHRYYFASFAPFIAGLLGIGVYLLSKNSRFSKIASIIIFALTAAVELFIQYEYQWLPILFYIMLGVFAAALALMIFAAVKGKGKKLISLSLLTLFIMPTVWSMTPIFYGDVTQIPISGPELRKQGNDIFKNSDYSELIAYLKKNQDGASFLCATPSAMDAGSSLILQSGEPVMCIGGFNGQDTPLTANEFAAICKKGTVKYALIGERSNSEVSQWIEKNGTLIDSSECGLNNSNYKLYKVG